MSAPYRRPTTGQIDDPAADFGESAGRDAPISGKGYVEVELDARNGPHFVPHGLGQSYRGAQCIGQTHPTSNVVVVHPRGYQDADKRVCVYQSIAAAQTIRLLVW